MCQKQRAAEEMTLSCRLFYFDASHRLICFDASNCLIYFDASHCLFYFDASLCRVVSSTLMCTHLLLCLDLLYVCTLIVRPCVSCVRQPFSDAQRCLPSWSRPCRCLYREDMGQSPQKPRLSFPQLVVCGKQREGAHETLQRAGTLCTLCPHSRGRIEVARGAWCATRKTMQCVCAAPGYTCVCTHACKRWCVSGEKQTRPERRSEER